MSAHRVEGCHTVVKFGDYQLFCDEEDKNEYMNGNYGYFYLNVYVNYPKFSHKEALRFVFSVINIFKIDDNFIEKIFFNQSQFLKNVSLTFLRNFRENAIIFSDYSTLNLT